MSRVRAITFLVIAIVAAGVCVRLGVWQLNRLAERRTANAAIARMLSLDPVELGTVPVDAASGGRRVRVSGVYDFDRELVLVNRSRDGAPGVNLLTPVRIPGADTAVLVNRGWVYSPDGGSVDPLQWREPPEVSAVGYVQWPTISASAASTRIDSSRRVLRVTPGLIAASMPYPVAPYHVVLLADSGTPPARGSPVRLEAPPLGEGSHKSYAIQWFSFAAIIVAGTAALLWRERAA